MRSELADLFELMHGAPDSFRTLRAVIRTTSDYEPLRSAQAREFEEADPDGWAAYVAEGGESGRGCCWFDCDYTTTLWIESPSAIREESDLPGDEVRVTRDAGQHPAPSAYPDLSRPLVLVPAVSTSKLTVRTSLRIEMAFGSRASAHVGRSHRALLAVEFPG